MLSQFNIFELTCECMLSGKDPELVRNWILSREYANMQLMSQLINVIKFPLSFVTELKNSLETQVSELKTQIENRCSLQWVSQTEWSKPMASKGVVGLGRASRSPGPSERKCKCGEKISREARQSRIIRNISRKNRRQRRRSRRRRGRRRKPRQRRQRRQRQKQTSQLTLKSKGRLFENRVVDGKTKIQVVMVCFMVDKSTIIILQSSSPRKIRCHQQGAQAA